MAGLGDLAIHPADLDLVSVGRALRAGTISARALVEAHLARIADRDPSIGAFVHLAGDEARAVADRADADLAEGLDRGPLHGIPFAVKDLIDVAGWPVRHGSSRHKDRVAEQTAPVVDRLQQAGAIPLGLVATYELATVGPDPTSLYPQPRNPWNLAHVTGGSSSGSAAAVAGGLVRLALGSDTGGSIRSPAAFCGISGLKPERAAIPGTGMQALSPTLDVIGPMAASVAELALMLAAMTGKPVLPTPGIAGLRIGFARSWAEDASAHPDLLPLLDAAASALSLQGAEIVLTKLPEYDPIEAVVARILQAEQTETHADILADKGRNVGGMAYDSLLWGHPLEPDETALARAEAAGITKGMETHLAAFDAVILPTTLAPAPPFSAFSAGKAAWTPMRTLPFNLTGHAALSVPMGFADGLPMGLQITGAYGRTETLLRIGAAYEAATDHTILSPYPA